MIKLWVSIVNGGKLHILVENIIKKGDFDYGEIDFAIR